MNPLRNSVFRGGRFAHEKVAPHEPVNINMWRNHDSHRVTTKEDLVAPSTIDNENHTKHNSSCSAKVLFLRRFISSDPQLLLHHHSPEVVDHKSTCVTLWNAQANFMSKESKSPRPSNGRTGCKCFHGPNCVDFAIS